jgi:hypothetical protein
MKKKIKAGKNFGLSVKSNGDYFGGNIEGYEEDINE